MSNYKIKDLPITSRPRERLKEVGVSNLSDVELLSIILKSGTKKKNVNDLSIELLKKYPLTKLQDLTINSLTSIKGIGEVKAMELLATIELGKRIFLKENTPLKKLNTPIKIYEHTKYLFYDIKQEYFYAIYFNNKQQLIGEKLLFIGTINKSVTHPREIFKEAYLLSASSIVVLHNHPSNDLTPSREDLDFTNNLISLGNLQGIPVIDHIIVGNNNYYSFYEHGEIRTFQSNKNKL